MEDKASYPGSALQAIPINNNDSVAVYSDQALVYQRAQCPADNLPHSAQAGSHLVLGQLPCRVRLFQQEFSEALRNGA